MIRILLIRHGNTDPLGHVLYGRLPGIHLNEEGRTQSRRLAAALRERYRLDEVISSPLERTLETANLLAGDQGVAITTDQRITEIDFGSWMGKSFDELQGDEDWRRYNEFRSLSHPPGGESLTEVQARGWRALEETMQRFHSQDEATVAAISHGDVIRSLLLLLLGMPIDFIHRLHIAPASMSEVVLGSGHPRVISVNQIF